MAGNSLPPPEWFDEMRRLRLLYVTQFDAIRRRPISESEKRERAGGLWLWVEQRKKPLLKLAVKGLRCTATKTNGERCGRNAMLEYIGQMCSSHAPPLDTWPDLEETRRIWAERERERS